MVGSQSKTTALSSAPMATPSPARAPAFSSCVLDTEAVEAVGEVADGLVVGEVGLADPALRLLAAHPVEAVLLLR